MRQAYVRLRFPQAAATAVTDVQFIDSIVELRELTDKEIENLCKVIRRPGGTIPNPNAGAPNAPATIPDPGIPVSLAAENNLKMAAFWLRHQVRVQRNPTPAEITLVNIRTLRELRDSEIAYEAPTEYPTINVKDWPKTIEAIREFLRIFLGETKIPLAYVIRDTVELPEGDDPSDGYATVQDEMIRRAPHGTQVYQTDNQMVWTIIAQISREHDCWTYVKPAQSTRDGRAAFQSLFNHYLGPNNVDNLSSAAEKRLQTVTYVGEQRRWNFEKYVKVHVDQFTILNGLVEHGYAGIDPRSRVRYLNDGIKTDKLDSVKTRIMSDARLRSDFDACVTLFQDFIRQVQAGQPKTLQISSVSADGGHGKRKATEVEDRYYTKQEYQALSQEQKKALRDKRLKRKGSKSEAKDKGQEGSGQAIKQLTRQISSMEKKIESLGASSAGGEEQGEEDNSGEAQEGQGNRGNPALTRQRGGRQG